MGINHCFPIPIWPCNSSEVINISGLHGTSEGTGRCIMDTGRLHNLAPTSTLAVEHTNHTRAFVHIPNFKQAAEQGQLNHFFILYKSMASCTQGKWVKVWTSNLSYETVEVMPLDLLVFGTNNIHLFNATLVLQTLLRYIDSSK